MAKLHALAEAFDNTYELSDLLELCDLTTEEVILLLLQQGLLDPGLPHEVIDIG